MSDNSHIVTSQEKIDAVFGITGGKSVDDFLNDLSLDTDKISNTLNSIDMSVKTTIDGIDQQANEIAKSNDAPTTLQICNMERSLKEIEDMISLSKRMFQHIAESILATDLIDSELVHAASVLMESIHVNIQEFISLYKTKSNFIDKIRFSLLQQQQKKDLMLYKHQLELEKIKEKNAANVIDVQAEGQQPYRQEDILNILKEVE